MTLIHTALLCEAQTFIEILKLKKTNSIPKIYSNEKYIVLIGGIGRENTLNSLEYVFKNYKILKAINIGIAGVSDSSIKIGELFCSNHMLQDIKWLPLKTVDKPQIENNNDKEYLYDMEGQYFLDICHNYLDKKDIFIFKVVSDHLSDDILAKDFIKKLIKNISKKILI
ncbi:MAG: hypothetical protein U9R39_05080 [Campylobacterota bacterium]|nr:hypothetical protein [Campylobacterota bacterium]